jgi:mannose-6-phosphate isomerase-like protein (cupin superfamily)
MDINGVDLVPITGVRASEPVGEPTSSVAGIGDGRHPWALAFRDRLVAMSVANVNEALSHVNEHWSPRVIARVNDSYVKVAKVKGHLTWHKHDGEDELFWVQRGRLRIEYEGGRVVEVGAGELHVVPRGTLHNPIADEECWIVLVEPVTTQHTGDIIMDKTKTIAEQLGAKT